METTTSSKFERLLAGENVITNDAEMDALEQLAYAKDLEILSLPNPQRAGALDKYVAWIERAGR